MNLLQKLRIDVGTEVWVAGAPDYLQELLPGATLLQGMPLHAPVQQLLLFVFNSTDLHHHLPRLMQIIEPQTLLWICYPKQTGSFSSDLVKMAPWQILFDAGFRGQTSVSIDADWSALRLTNAPPKKATIASLPLAERRVEGIDFVKRTTSLPEDVQAALAPVDGLTEFFENMAFSHRKEYLMAIAEAKKPETRARRIAAMVNSLQELQREKALKKQARAGKH